MGKNKNKDKKSTGLAHRLRTLMPVEEHNPQTVKGYVDDNWDELVRVLEVCAAAGQKDAYLNTVMRNLEPIDNEVFEDMVRKEIVKRLKEEGLGVRWRSSAFDGLYLITW